MKKLFVGLLLLCFSLNIVAQDSTKSALADSSKLTLMKVYNDTKAGITGLATALKAPVTEVFGILVKQQVVNSIIDICIYIFLFILIIIGYNTSKKYYPLAKNEVKDNRGDWYDQTNGVIAIISGLVSTVLLIAITITVCSTVSDVITGFINPKYGAIKEIISFVK